jgi:ribosome maturation factor RimP
MRRSRHELEAAVERTLAAGFPEVELLDLEVKGVDRLAVYIDRPGGVDLDLCAAVSTALDELRSDYALEVSSPGLDRPLRKAAHFAAAVGREVAVRTTAPVDGRSNFRGTLVGADEASFTMELADGGGEVTLAVADVARARVVHSFDT